MAVEKHEYVPKPRWTASPCQYRLPHGYACMMPSEHAIHQTFEQMVAEFEAELAKRDRLLMHAAWDLGCDFAVRHPDMNAEYFRSANPYNDVSEETP
jgi:hypothetical protein